MHKIGQTRPVSEVINLKKSKYAPKIFSYLFVLLSFYLLLWQFLIRHIALPTYFYGRLIEVLGVSVFILLALTVPLRFEKMGIVCTPDCISDSLSLGALLSAFFLGTLLLYRLLSGLPPTFSWHIRGDISRLTYFLVAPFQEILSKSVLLYAFEIALDDRPRTANLLAALTFAALHVAYGIAMMLAAFALSLITGAMFQKKRSVWGPALLHFICGFFPTCLGF